MPDPVKAPRIKSVSLPPFSVPPFSKSCASGAVLASSVTVKPVPIVTLSPEIGSVLAFHVEVFVQLPLAIADFCVALAFGMKIEYKIARTNNMPNSGRSLK